MKNNKLIVFGALLIGLVSLVGCEMSCVDNECFDPDVSTIRGMSNLPLGYYEFGDTHETNYIPNQVFVKKFQLDQNEVTLGDYNKCIASGDCTTPVSAYDETGCVYGAGDPRHPINCVTPVQAFEYCAFVGKRLPTEIEWEYAAKGIVYSEYPWGNKFDGQSACYNNDKTCMVGTHVETLLGMPYQEAKKNWPNVGPLLDLAGNVAEILDTEYKPAGYKTNTACTGVCAVRGGSWLSKAKSELSTTHRDKIGMVEHSPAVGFRCAHD